MRRPAKRPALIGLVCLLVAVVVTFLAFRRDVPFVNEPFTIEAAFRDSSGIRPNSPVRIAGVEVGRVREVERVGTGGSTAAVVTMSVKDSGRPIHRDASAKIRPRIFLEGNFFVDLKPGTPSAPAMEQGDRIPTDRTANPVQLDEVLSTLRIDTRQALRELLGEISTAQQAGAAKALARSYEPGIPALRDSAIASQALLGEDEGDLRKFLRAQGVVAAGLDANPQKLRSLIVQLEDAFGAIASRDDDLRASLEELPRTLRIAQPTLASLRAAFPDVRAFAAEARPAVRSTGPTARALTPLTVQLRRLVGEDELRGLARDLRRSTPPLAELARRSVPLLEQARRLASCTSRVLVPFGNSKVGDPDFPASGPVYTQAGKSVVGLAGESRSSDANGQWFKVQGGGGADTISLGNNLVGSATRPFTGVNPPRVSQRPPLEPDAPCEVQELPDLNSNPVRPPRPIDDTTQAIRDRIAKARDTAIGVQRELLEAAGNTTTQVLGNDATAQQIAAVSGVLTGAVEALPFGSSSRVARARRAQRAKARRARGADARASRRAAARADAEAARSRTTTTTAPQGLTTTAPSTTTTTTPTGGGKP